MLGVDVPLVPISGLSFNINPNHFLAISINTQLHPHIINLTFFILN